MNPPACAPSGLNDYDAQDAVRALCQAIARGSRVHLQKMVDELPDRMASYPGFMDHRYLGLPMALWCRARPQTAKFVKEHAGIPAHSGHADQALLPPGLHKRSVRAGQRLLTALASASVYELDNALIKYQQVGLDINAALPDLDPPMAPLPWLTKLMGTYRYLDLTKAQNDNLLWMVARLVKAGANPLQPGSKAASDLWAFAQMLDVAEPRSFPGNRHQLAALLAATAVDQPWPQGYLGQTMALLDLASSGFLDWEKTLKHRAWHPDTLADTLPALLAPDPTPHRQPQTSYNQDTFIMIGDLSSSLSGASPGERAIQSGVRAWLSRLLPSDLRRLREPHLYAMPPNLRGDIRAVRAGALAAMPVVHGMIDALVLERALDSKSAPHGKVETSRPARRM